MLVALKSGLYDIVKAALAGAIIGNILRVHSPAEFPSEPR